MSEFPNATQPGAPMPSIALLACGVFDSELALHASNQSQIKTHVRFEIGLHDHPDTLRSTLQEAIGQLDSREDIDAIVLLYGLCGCGTAGLRAGSHPLVIPRAHDCITVFMGSKESYAGQQKSCPGCYYYTPGWNRARRVPGPERVEMLRAELSQRFDEEDVEFLLEADRDQWALNDTALYLDLGTEDAEAEAAYSRRCADWLGWRFERMRGDAQMLKDLLGGHWDSDRFQIIRPGEQLAHSPDDAIMRAEPAGRKGQA